MDPLAAVQHLLTLPVLEERVDEHRVQVTNMLQSTIDVLGVRNHLRTRNASMYYKTDRAIIKRDLRSDLPEILRYLKLIC